MSVLTTLMLTRLGLFSSLEPLNQQLLFKARGSQAWHEEIVLIKIDQASIDALGWFPWRRDRYTRLLEQLTAAEASTVAFNILFSEETNEDAAFAKAIANHGRVLLANTWHRDQNPWMPSPTLAQESIGIGHMAQVETTRPVSVKPYIQGYPALAIATGKVHQLNNQGELQLRRFNQPLLPNWPGPVEQLQQYSFIDVLEQRVPKEKLQGKIALVGMTAEGFDPLISPIEPNQAVSGIHLHAALLHSYLQQDFLQRPRQSWGRLWLLLWVLSLRYGLSRLTERKQLLTLSVGLFLWPILGVLALHANILLPIAFPLLLLSTAAFSILVVNNIQLQNINSQLESKATTDVLTKLRNRAFFNDYSAYIWHNCVREKQSVCLILCDIDHFKEYNDTYGHVEGDHCLYTVAQSLQASMYCSSDIVARYGGEEFIILLPNATLDNGCAVTERIQNQLAKQAIPHQSSPSNSYITLSFGIACIQPTGKNRLMVLIEQADKALYQAKKDGRDRYKSKQL